jgi:hypothetical protein
LYLATWTGAVWEHDRISMGGRVPSIRLDAMDRPHVVYWNALSSQVIHAD